MANLMNPALLVDLMARNVRPTCSTFVHILSSQPLDLSHGVQLHTLLLKTGLLHSNPYSATALVNHYGKNTRTYDAVNLFDEMPTRTVVTWNCITSVFTRMHRVQDSIFLFRELLRSEFRPSECSFLSILPAFRSSESSSSLEQVHGLVIKLSMEHYTVISNSLLSAYSSCFRDNVVLKLFSSLPIRDLISWNASIAAFAKGDSPAKALELFARMSSEGVSPNENTLASVIDACTGVGLLVCGELIHAKAIKLNLSTSVYVGTALVDLYAKCGSIEDAQILFTEIPDKNLVTWNALISGYSNNNSVSALTIFREMLRYGFRPNEFSFSSILKKASALDLRQLHSLEIRMGFHSDSYVLTALIASYAAHDMISDALAFNTVSDYSLVGPNNVIGSIHNKMGRYEDAKETLLQLQDPDTITWNILIAACARNGDYSEGFELFKRMQIAGYLLDNYMAVSLLSICSKISSLRLGSSLHAFIIKSNAGCSEVFVANVLMDMYAKCGNLISCVRVFEDMKERNLISWTALVSGLGLHGCTHEALERFRQMEVDGWKPDRVTFLAVLSACRHGGAVEEGMLLFQKMKSVYGVEPEIDHYVILVDLLCRYGKLKEAEQVINEMPFQQNAVIWRTFLQGCEKYPKLVSSLSI